MRRLVTLKPGESRRALFFFSVISLFTISAIYSAANRDQMRLGGWLMFAGYGADVCQVRYELAEADGQLRPIDYLSQLGYPPGTRAPDDLRIVRSIPQALRVGKRLCQDKTKVVLTEISCVEGPQWKKLISRSDECGS